MSTIIQTWSILDKLYYLCSRLQLVDQTEQNIFRVRLLTYRGPSLSLEDGTTIHSSDILLKIHLHNCLLMREMQHIQNDVKRALYVYHRVEESLPGLARFLASHPDQEKIKALLGITLLTRGVKPLGFEVVDISNSVYKTLKELFLIPMFILLHPNGKLKCLKKGNLTPKYLVMPKERLLDRYSISSLMGCPPPMSSSE
ncbi:hypothetical protein [Ammoniphilus sp. 3BR4]|uniref:YkoP family protein n=1 Tax=Ammoniphilus sp. 3BR4 TaxID=3158265 RepID=UPI003465B2B1